jgi:hypothetical protein
VRKRKVADLTAEELVVELHPYNEWSARHTDAATRQIVELVRYLNHATQHPEALPNPVAVADLLQVLGQTVRRLPQVLQQAARRVEAFAADPDLRLDGGDDPADAARSVSRALVDDGEQAGELGEQLDAAGREIERVSFEARRLRLGRDDGVHQGWLA